MSNMENNAPESLEIKLENMRKSRATSSPAPSRTCILTASARGENGGEMVNALSHFITFCAGGAVGILAFCYLYHTRDS